MIIFGLFSIHYTCTSLERTLGSVYFILDFILKNIFTQIIYVALSFLLNIIIEGKWLMIPSYGLWNTAMIYITLRSLSNPEA
jgi:hypothetical protein